MVNFSRMVALGVVLLMMVPGIAASQSPPKEQLDLILKGVEASDAGQLEDAANFYKAALILGPLNVAHMGLGRVLQKQGECAEADDNFKKALSSQTVKEPSPAQVRAAVERFRAELVRDCPGRIVVECSPPNAAVTIGGKAVKCGAATEVPAGEHRVVGTAFGDKTDSRTVAVKGLETVSIKIAIKAPDKIVPDPDPDPVPGTSSVGGWVLVGTGAALLAGAGFAGFLVFDFNEDVGEAIDNRDVDFGEESADSALLSEIAMWTGLGTGALALTIGIVLLMDDEDPDTGQSFWLTPLPDGHGVGAGFQTTF